MDLRNAPPLAERFDDFRQKGIHEMKKMIGALLLAVLCGTGTFAQTETEFEVRLTNDGKGAVILKYTGRATQVRIPATIQGVPVREIGSGDVAVIGSEVAGVVIPTGVTKINAYAFYNPDSKLAFVTIPEGVTEIGYCAFYGTALTSVTLPKSLTSIGWEAFGYTKLSSITIPPSVTKIEWGAFEGCENLKMVTISEGVMEIGVEAFENCSSLTTVTLPASLQDIWNRAFSGCSSLTAIALPTGLQGIGARAFEGCTSLTTVTLPASLRFLEYEAFRYCSSLTTVTYPDTIQVASLGDAAWGGGEVPEDVGSAASVFKDCPKLSLASQAAIKKLDEIAKANRE
jgi:hypothetical protein